MVVDGIFVKRSEIIEKFKDYDIVIILYFFLKRDIDFYKDLEFLVCVVDEV